MIGHEAHAGSFSELADYLERGDDGTHEGRIAWHEARNVWAPTVSDAASVMTVLSFGSRTPRPAYHLSVSFDPDDLVDRYVMVYVADRLLADLGLSAHPAVIVAHSDRDHPHFHLMAGKVDPETGRVWKADFTHRTIEKCLRELERELGLRETPGHLFRLPGQEPPDRSRTLRAGVLRREERTGERSYLERAREEIAGDFADAASYPDLASRLRRKGHWLEERPRGLVVTDGQNYAAVSAVSPSASRAKLQARFGATFSEFAASNAPGGHLAPTDHDADDEQDRRGGRGRGGHPAQQDAPEREERDAGTRRYAAASHPTRPDDRADTGTSQAGRSGTSDARDPAGGAGAAAGASGGGSAGGAERDLSRPDPIRDPLAGPRSGPGSVRRRGGQGRAAPARSDGRSHARSGIRVTRGTRRHPVDGGGTGHRRGSGGEDVGDVPGKLADRDHEAGRDLHPRRAARNGDGVPNRDHGEAPHGPRPEPPARDRGSEAAPGLAALGHGREHVARRGRGHDAPSSRVDDEPGAAPGAPGRGSGHLHVQRGESGGEDGDAQGDALAGARASGHDRGTPGPRPGAALTPEASRFSLYEEGGLYGIFDRTGPQIYFAETRREAISALDECVGRDAPPRALHDMDAAWRRSRGLPTLEAGPGGPDPGSASGPAARLSARGPAGARERAVEHAAQPGLSPVAHVLQLAAQVEAAEASRKHLVSCRRAWRETAQAARALQGAWEAAAPLWTQFRNTVAELYGPHAGRVVEHVLSQARAGRGPAVVASLRDTPRTLIPAPRPRVLPGTVHQAVRAADELGPLLPTLHRLDAALSRAGTRTGDAERGALEEEVGRAARALAARLTLEDREVSSARAALRTAAPSTTSTTLKNAWRSLGPAERSAVAVVNPQIEALLDRPRHRRRDQGGGGMAL